MCGAITAGINARVSAYLYPSLVLVQFPITDENAEFIVDEDLNPIAGDSHPLAGLDNP